jgi:predicted TIM-barrel fold metal-dependent hydrolase
MDVGNLILISVDDHIIEPPDLFDAHLPERYRDRAPKVVRKPDGTDVWLFEGVELPNIGLNAVAGRPMDEYGVEPTSFDELRPGCYDVHERVRDMNANGVLGSMNFPSFTGYAAKTFARSPDRDLGLALVKAYNDWHIEEWCGSYPDRFIPIALPILWDPEALASEVRRVAGKGCHSISFSENPVPLGYPSLHSDYWEPFWKACSDEGTVVSIHIGSSSQVPVTTPDAPIDVMISLGNMNTAAVASDLLWSPVLRRYPSLRFALSEGGTGWIPYLLERVDQVYSRHRAWTHQEFGDKLPSEVFREHMITCFIDDGVGIRLRYDIGVENLTWECDYPHSDSLWPNSPESLADQLDGVPEAEVALITHGNAMREFQFDPFSVRSRENCTVNALRLEGADVDTTMRSPSLKKKDMHNRPVTVSDLTVMA